MGVYVFLCIVLLGMITAPTAKTDDGPASKDNFQMQNTQSADHIRVVRDAPDDVEDTIIGKKFSAEGKGFNCIKNICEDAHDYPSEHIENVTKKFEHLKVFGKPRGVYDKPTNKMSKDQNANLVCAVNTYNKFPKIMTNEDKVSKFIVNVGLQQGIQFSICVNPSQPPKEASFPENYTSQCEQKYSRIRLLSIENDSEGEAAFDDFVVPTSCILTFKKPKK